MKKSEIRELKVVTIQGDSVYKIPEDYQIIKEPTKMSENGTDVFKIVLAKA